MSEKKYDVYVDNNKVGEVWGESALEIEAREEVRAHSHARRTLETLDMLAPTAEGAMRRNELRRMDKETTGQKKLWGWMCIVGVILCLANVSMLPVGAEETFLDAVARLLLSILISVDALIAAVLVAAYIILGKIEFTGGEVLQKIVGILAVISYIYFGPFHWTLLMFAFFLNAVIEAHRASKELSYAEDIAIIEKDIM